MPANEREEGVVEDKDACNGFFCGCGVTLWMTTGHAVNCRKMDIRDKLCL